MFKYYIVYYQDGKSVAGTYVIADSEAEALLDAEFKIICRFPNVAYNGMEITQTIKL